MRDVSIIGIGQVEVGEHWDKSLRELGYYALNAAMRDACIQHIDSLYVGNMLSGELTGQEHIGSIIADFAGLRGVEAVKIEAACGSGAAALRMGYIAVAGGMSDFVACMGVEKMTDRQGNTVTSALAMAADGDYEALHGLSFVSINALLMRRYMHEHGYTKDDFAPFAINAHANAVNNPYAMFHNPITRKQFTESKMIADPVSLLDSSPIADGAACVILAPTAIAREFTEKPVRVRASAIATDSVAVHDRRDPLFLEGGAISAQKAYSAAGVGPADMDLFEVHDAFTIMSALSLEAAGFASRGKGVALAQEGQIMPGGRIPITTMGGLKARGHPVGATGMYQLVELATQLRGEAGKSQLANARLGMAQNIGGSGATVVTTILESSF
ncbi:MAG: thiolase domain-containing protein [Chloroflexi bacterium]|nr:thiolase domain-containing protein [Chloroflexota bacterium]MCL5273844.1 thiolase domain-containing protein [Chloroflexota bacterium]